MSESTSIWFEKLLKKFENDYEFLWDLWDLLEDEYPFDSSTCDEYTEIN